MRRGINTGSIIQKLKFNWVGPRSLDGSPDVGVDHGAEALPHLGVRDQGLAKCERRGGIAQLGRHDNGLHVFACRVGRNADGDFFAATNDV